MHFERDVYIHQMLLLFRRQGLTGSLDSLEYFEAYKDGPCMMLGLIALFWTTCKNFLFLVVLVPGLRFRF
jgi:hypothetical protein